MAVLKQLPPTARLKRTNDTKCLLYISGAIKRICLSPFLALLIFDALPVGSRWGLSAHPLLL